MVHRQRFLKHGFHVVNLLNLEKVLNPTNLSSLIPKTLTLHDPQMVLQIHHLMISILLILIKYRSLHEMEPIIHQTCLMLLTMTILLMMATHLINHLHIIVHLLRIIIIHRALHILILSVTDQRMLWNGND